MKVHLGSNWEQMVDDSHDFVSAEEYELEQELNEVEALIAQGRRLLTQMGQDGIDEELLVELSDVADALGNEELLEACDIDLGTGIDSLVELFGGCYDRRAELLEQLGWEE